MEYAIAIDSGGTNYRLRAVDRFGTILGECTCQSANHYHVGLEALPSIVNGNIDSLLSLFGGRREDCRALVCGTTGLDSSEDEDLLTSFYSGRCGLSCPVSIINDAELAHYAVTGGEGMLIISGTGAIGFGRSREGRTGRAGGWLFPILGDEGGGSWVARRVLQHLSRWFDGFVLDSPLLSDVRKMLSLETRDDLNRYARKMGEPPWETPKVGKLVSDHADAGEDDAVGICREAAAYLFQLVLDLDASLSISPTFPDFPIGLWGSTILGSAVMQEELSKLVHGRYPDARIVLPTKSALDQAAEMALELWGMR